MRKIILIFLLMLSIASAYAQQKYSISQISPELLKNADAVIREHHQKYTIKSLDKIVVETYKVVSVFNEHGASFIGAREFYSEGDKVVDQEVYILDAAGKEIKKIKKKDFNDVSAYGSSTLFSDSRVSYLNYTPRSYPYTAIYTSEFEYENSIFLPSWSPVEGYDVSIEKSVFEIENPNNFPLRHREENFEGSRISNDSNANIFKYTAENIPAKVYEAFSPPLINMVPRVLFAMDEFELEGVTGYNRDWKQFGKWMYDNLVASHDKLSAETIHTINNLTKDAKTLEEKARIIYQYVQDKTRYISVQYGIGGWEPESAFLVDDLGYGDCKALTNYTMALLKTQGIKSHYTVVYSGSRRGFNPDFSMMGGNHAILNIPRKDTTDIWLECTSQKIPFNYLGDFTDDRHVFRISEDGGEIVKTTKYDVSENLQKIECTLQLDATGGFVADFNRSTFGIPYGDKYYLVDRDEDELKQHYRDAWSRIQNLNFEDIQLENDRVAIEFKENLKFSGERLATSAGDMLLIPLNFIQQESLITHSASERTMPLHMSRGKTYNDHFVFKLPEGFEIEALPKSQNIVSDFGKFHIEINRVSDSQPAIEVNRLLVLNEGDWPVERFADFEQFLAKVSRLHNLKAVIVNKEKS